MKLNYKNIDRVIADIDESIKDVLMEETALFEKIRFGNGVTIYNGIAFKFRGVPVYIELNMIRNDITMYISGGDYIGAVANENLESLRQASVPAWVLYQISNI